LICLRLNV